MSTRKKPTGTGLGRHIYSRRSKRSPTGFVYWGDFRAFGHVGGRQEALRPRGAKMATHDREVARKLYVERLESYDAKARGMAMGYAEDPRLGEAIEWHLKEKIKSRTVRRSTVERDEQSLKNVFHHFGNCRLSAITPTRLTDYVEKRRSKPGVSAGSTTADGTIRNELNALSSLFKRAISKDKASANPVARMVDRPQPTKEEASFLSRQEAALLLDAAAVEDEETRRAREAAGLRMRAREHGDARANSLARQLRAKARALSPMQGRFGNRNRDYPDVEALLATLLYTGGRRSEVLGLLCDDIDFEAGRIRFGPNSHRPLKKAHHRRWVELWPPLADTLRTYMARNGLKDGLLFPSASAAMMHGCNKQLERACVRADALAMERGVTLSRRLSGRISPHSLRHTYATALLRTIETGPNGQKVMRSAFSVGRALGHKKGTLVEETYGHISPEELMDTLSYEAGRLLPASRLMEARPPEAREDRDAARR